jgi:hypothetical protein
VRVCVFVCAMRHMRVHQCARQEAVHSNRREFLYYYSLLYMSTLCVLALYSLALLCIYSLQFSVYEYSASACSVFTRKLRPTPRKYSVVLILLYFTLFVLNVLLCITRSPQKILVCYNIIIFYCISVSIFCVPLSYLPVSSLRRSSPFDTLVRLLNTG